MQQAIRPNVIDLQLSNYTDPVYGATTRLKVAETPKMGASTTLDQITDNTHGPKIHPANIQEVSNIIKDKITDKNFIDGFNNTTHANNCVKATGSGQSSDIENIICQLRQQYEAVADNNKKEELFNFIKYLNGEKNANNTNWRFETYVDKDGKGFEVEIYYKKLLGTFVEPTTSYNTDTIEKIKVLINNVKNKLTNTANVYVINQIKGIDRANDQIQYEAGKKNDTYFNSYIYNLNELLKLFKGTLYFNYSLNMYKTSKPMTEDEIFNFIIKKNVLKAASSNLGTGIYNMFSKTGNSSPSVANQGQTVANQGQTVANQVQPAANQLQTAAVPNAPPVDSAVKQPLIDLVNAKLTAGKWTYQTNLKQKLIDEITNTNDATLFANIKTNIERIFNNQEQIYKYNYDLTNGNSIVDKNGNGFDKIDDFIKYIKNPPPQPKKGLFSSFSSFFGKGGKSKKNKKSHSKKQKKSSRKQQKKRKSAKK